MPKKRAADNDVGPQYDDLATASVAGELESLQTDKRWPGTLYFPKDEFGVISMPSAAVQEPLSPDDFSALMKLKRWTGKDLAAQWQMSPVTLSRHIHNYRRPRHLDDALIGLPPFFVNDAEAWRVCAVRAAAEHERRIRDALEAELQPGRRVRCVKRGKWPCLGPLIDPDNDSIEAELNRPRRLQEDYPRPSVFIPSPWFIEDETWAQRRRRMLREEWEFYTLGR